MNLNDTNTLSPGVATAPKEVRQMTLDEVLLDYVSQIYNSTGKSVNKTSKILGIGRSTVYRYLNRLGEK